MGKPSEEQKLKGFKHHTDTYTEKPFNINLLKIQIKNFLQLRKNIKFKDHELIKSVDDNILPLDKVFLDKVFDLIQSEITNSEL